MKPTLPRLCIYPKDIARITGRSYRQSTRIYQNIKKHYNKKANQFVSIYDFCEFTGLPVPMVLQQLE